MKRLLSVENMRKSDAATIAGGISGRELMWRAGRGIYDALDESGMLCDNKIVIVCGSGNNAGDGYVLALLLRENNIPCRLLIASEKFSDDGRYYFDKCCAVGIDYKFGEDAFAAFMQEAKAGLEDEESTEQYLIVDCLLGTGFKGTPREPLSTVIRGINNLKNINKNRVSVVCVDINSGLNGDSGQAENCVISDLTVSIGDLMPGLVLGAAKDVIGRIVNVPIGIEPVDEPFYLFEEDDCRKCVPVRDNNCNKGTFGYMGLIGGSYKYSGAITLATMANAAMRSGAGVVMVATPKKVCDLIIPKILESTVFPLSDDDGECVFAPDELDTFMKRVGVIAFGMGIGRTTETKKMLEYILAKFPGVLIIDADGLNCLADIGAQAIRNAACSRVILTPHPKEFSRLSGVQVETVLGSPIEHARAYALDTNSIVLLKGTATVVTDGDKVILVDRGCAGMATAGSGDVLSGIIAAVCGYNKKNLLEATASAAFINGYAGELAQAEYGSVAMIAGDTVRNIAAAVRKISENC